MIIEMGSNQFLVDNIEYGQNGISVTLVINEGPEVGNSFEFTLNENNFYKVGRKTENHLSIVNDQHLSNLHARFYIMEDNVHIEDITSTNGTWRRLSQESTTSQEFMIQDGDWFKIGSVSTFKIQINSTLK